MSLFNELKRRNVFRVGIAYVVGAWLLAQAADLVLDVIGAPGIVLQSLVALLALGLIPTVVVSWVYEMTPEGVKKATEVDLDTSITHKTGKKLDITTIVLLVIAIAFLFLQPYLPGRQVEAPVSATQTALEEQPATESVQKATATSGHPSTSIAVLPFANRSNQDDDLYFTDGIHDDLLTQLAKIDDLTVISRTSVMEYRDSPKKLGEIGQELKVGTILEGGVQKVGDRVRINAQLIDVGTDRHLWAETFDRELTAENVFELQSEIARKIVRAISVELSPEEERQLDSIPTRSLAAYEAYLQARRIFYGANYARSQEEAARPYIEKAIELDPNYAAAYALLTHILAQIYWRGIDTSEEFLEKYRKTIDRANELAPDSPEALRARANYHYRVENDYAQSLALLERAIARAPGNVDLHGDRGLSLRRMGRWDESIASFKHALELDPANKFYRTILLETMADAEQWQAILDNSVALEDADPDELDIQISRAVALLNLTGDLEPLERVFDRMNPTGSTQYLSYGAYVHIMRRDYDRAIEVLNGPVFEELAKQPVGRSVRLAQLANAWRLKGDLERAEDYYQQIVADLDTVMNSSMQTQVYSGGRIAEALVWLGRHEEALDLANRLIEENPPEADSLVASAPLYRRARVRGLLGDFDGAISDLTTSLQMHGNGFTAWDLYYDPNWDFMRDDPRFVELATPDNLIQ